MQTSHTTRAGAALAFCLSLGRAYAVLGRRFDGRLGSWHGISLADLAMLYELHRAPGGRLRRVDLAERLGLTASAVTRALIPLEKIGMVTRKTDASDARVSLATLTASGKRVLEEALESADAIGREILPEDAAALDDLGRVLDRIGRA
jgi:DNA-binding MarR family transcriptional regulator